MSILTLTICLSSIVQLSLTAAKNMLGFLKRRTKKESHGHYVLALDIGTEFVKALIFEAKGAKGIVIGFGKARQKLGDMSNGAVTDIGGVIDNCQAAIAEAEKQAGVIPTQMIMGIAGELVKGDTTVTTYRRKNPETKIDLSELKNIVHKLQWRCFEDVRTQLAKETGYNEIDIKLVNAAIVGMEIDGYKVSNPIGFQGKEVTVTIFNAFAPLVHFGALQTIASELDIELLAITSEPYAVARSMGFEDSGDLSTIFIDIGGGTTDIALVNNGTVEGTRMFMIGGRTFTKRLAHTLNVSFLDAEEIKLAYSDENLEKHSYQIVREAMKSDADVWLSGVELSLDDFKNVDTLPTRILLSGGGSNLPEIKEALESKEWYKNLSFAEQPKISFLTPRDITNIEDQTGQLKGPEHITPLALANLAIDLAGEEQIITSLLRKVVRLMQVG